MESLVTFIFILASLSTIYGLAVDTPIASSPPITSSPVLKQKVYDCTRKMNAPNDSISCTKEFNSLNSTPQGINTFRTKYPCCLCNAAYPDCVSAQGGVLIRNVIVGTNNNPDLVAGFAIITNDTNFKPRTESTCLLKSDCSTSTFCVNKCFTFTHVYGQKRGLMMLRKRFKCCQCGSPFFGGCHNCDCAIGSAFVTKKVEYLRIGIFASGIVIV